MEQFTHEMVPVLMKHGMPVKNNKGLYFMLFNSSYRNFLKLSMGYG